MVSAIGKIILLIEFSHSFHFYESDHCGRTQSYEKQSFHSGTPPPFNLAGTQTAGATSQAYGAQQLYIQAMPATLHNMNMHQQIHQVSVYSNIC